MPVHTVQVDAIGAPLLVSHATRNNISASIAPWLALSYFCGDTFPSFFHAVGQEGSRADIRSRVLDSEHFIW